MQNRIIEFFDSQLKVSNLKSIEHYIKLSKSHWADIKTDFLLKSLLVQLKYVEEQPFYNRRLINESTCPITICSYYDSYSKQYEKWLASIHGCKSIVEEALDYLQKLNKPSKPMMAADQR